MTNDSPTDDARPAGDSGRSFWLLLGILIVAGAVLIALQARWPRPADPFVGLPLPPLQVGGWLNTEKPLTTADLNGKVVLVDYWATYCGPCLRQMPELEELYERYREAGLVMVGLTSEGGASTEFVKNFVETHDGMVWPVGYAAGPTYEMMGIRSIPTYTLYDRTGQSVWGGHSLVGLEDAITAALAKKD